MFRLFQADVRFGYGTDARKPPVVNKARGGSIMVQSLFKWQSLGLLVYLNISLISNHYIVLLYDNLHPFMDSIYPINDGLF